MQIVGVRSSLIEAVLSAITKRASLGRGWVSRRLWPPFSGFYVCLEKDALRPAGGFGMDVGGARDWP
jgi:hypothetical protein